MKGGRVTVTAGCGVTRHAVAGSRSSEAEVELLVADVDGRRGTEKQLLLEVASLGRQQKGLKAQEQRVISLRWKVVVGKGKEQMKQLPLEVVKVPKWSVIFLLCEAG